MHNAARYVLQDPPLGIGGYATVHKCLDTTKSRFACKRLPKEKNRPDRVHHEVRMLQHLIHCSRVPRFVEAIEDKDAWYIIQEWCKGGTIHNYIGGRNYNQNTVASITRGVLRGLHQVHSRGVIHRDVKSANVLFADQNEDAEIKIIDFGTAVLYETENSLVDLKEMVGTPWFMSPEHLVFKCCTRSDIWSVGVMVFHMLYGRLPFNDRSSPAQPNFAALCKSILEEEPRYESSHLIIDRDAVHFLRCCLAKEWQARPSAVELLNHPWLTKTDCSDRFVADGGGIIPVVDWTPCDFAARTLVSGAASKN